MMRSLHTRCLLKSRVPRYRNPTQREFLRIMEIVAVIPARFGSTRLPGKPLLSETGFPLIQHVVEAAQGSARLTRIIVATDDTRIADAVAAFGGEAVMTSPDHPSGTDRVAEVALGINGRRPLRQPARRRARDQRPGDRSPGGHDGT